MGGGADAWCRIGQKAFRFLFRQHSQRACECEFGWVGSIVLIRSVWMAAVELARRVILEGASDDWESWTDLDDAFGKGHGFIYGCVGKGELRGK